MLSPGSRLGAYEVTALIGQGGMGEVYRATDVNLKRSVALKVLPSSLAGDADRLARFQHRAREYAVSGDGRFLISTAEENRLSDSVSVILNWFERPR